MTLPAHWNTVPVTGTFVDRNGDPAVGQVVFSSSQTVTIDGVVVVPASIHVDLDADGHFSADIPSTDDPDIAPSGGWAYTVHEGFTGGRDDYQIVIPYYAVGIDLAAVTPAVVEASRAVYKLVVGTVTAAPMGTPAAATLTDVSNGVQALNLTLPAGDPATNIVQSVFGRTGAVVAKAGDYTFDQIAGTPTTLAGYGINDAAPLSHVGAGGSAHALVTSGAAGFMSPADKDKLDALATVATSGQYADLLGLPALGSASSHAASDFLASSALGVANGAAGLDATGKVPSSQIPASVLGQMQVMGPWDASKGTAPSTTPATGNYWLVTTAGTTSLNGIADWKVGDWAVYDATLGWYKCDNTDAVVSVAGLTGAVATAALKTALALDHVDNTADADKPVSTAQAQALAAKLDKTATAQAALKLATARTIALGGLLGGSVSFDGSGNVTIQATMADAALAIAKVGGLQNALNAKLASSDVGAPDGAGSLNSAGASPVTERRTPIVDLGSLTGAVTIDLSAGGIFTATLTGDITIAYSHLPASGLAAEVVLLLTQDSAGAHAVVWPAGTVWPGGYAYTGGSVAGVVDEVGLSVSSDGTAHAYPVEGWA